MKFLQTWVKIRWLFGGEFKPNFFLIGANASIDRGKSFQILFLANIKEKMLKKWLGKKLKASIFPKIMAFLLVSQNPCLWKPNPVSKWSLIPSQRWKECTKGFQRMLLHIIKIHLRYHSCPKLEKLAKKSPMHLGIPVQSKKSRWLCGYFRPEKTCISWQILL